MLYEFSNGIFINLREVVTMACHSNNTIEITMTNRNPILVIAKIAKKCNLYDWIFKVV